MLIRTAHTHPARAERSGAAVVETAFVLLIVFTLMLGIFEYGRFLMVLNVCENAVREGARLAVVQVTAGKSGAEIAATTDVIKDRVIAKLGPVANWLNVTRGQVTVVALDPVAFTDAGGWDTARPSDPIAVRIGIRQTGSDLPTGGAAVRYSPAVVGLLNMPNQINIFAQASMGSEAN